eukprot:UN09001
MRYVRENGIADETCQQYQAKDDPHGNNTNLNICENCVFFSCFPQTTFQLYWVTEYGAVNGTDNMKKEIYARGPISCGIDATLQLEEYTGGVFSERKVFPVLNHEISVIGWGITAADEEYWVVRNSWGTYWGEEGFFRIQMYSDNLGIEWDCTWGVPSTTKE